MNTLSKLCLCICMLAACNPLIIIASPQPDPDSLLRELKRHPDTATINAMLDIARDIAPTDLGRAMEYANILNQLADSLDYENGIIDVMNLKTTIYLFLGKMDSANMVCERAIHLSDSLLDFKRLATATYHLGVLMYMTEDVRRAGVLFLKSYEYSLLIADSMGMANMLNGLGAIYFELAKYDSAMQFLFESIRIAEVNGYDIILGKAYLNLGLVYENMKENQMAKRYFLKSIIYNERQNHVINLSKAYQNIGNILVQEDDLDSAWTLYNKALELNLSMNSPEGIAHAYVGLGDVADRRNEYDRAKVFFTKAANYYRMGNNRQGLLITYKNLGMIEGRKGNYIRALQVYDSSLIIARDLGFMTRVLEIYLNISDTYASMGDFKTAYSYMKDSYYLSDSILNIEKREKMADLEVKYAKEKDKAEILALKNENLEKDLALEQRTRQRNTYLFSGSGIVLVLVFLFTYYSQRTRKNRIIAEQRIHQLEEEKKLLAARSIVEGQEEERKRIAQELHDGLGVLLSSAKMHFTTIRDKSPESQTMIDKATKLLEQATGDVRRISHNMMPGLLTKYGFYEAIEELIEQVDEMIGIQAELKIEGEKTRLKENTEIMLYRIIQEMVNNTLKHAEAKNVGLNIRIKDGNLDVDYRDDGVGFDFDEKIKNKSMGLTGLQSRVKFLGGELKIITEIGGGVRYKFRVEV